MKKQNNIKSDDIMGVTISVIVVSVFSVTLMFIMYADLRSQIDSLPHKYCHNETIGISELNLSSCNNDIDITGRYEYLLYNCSRMFVEEQKEVCEIR